ncbi:MAG: response regulator transcription factor [Gluconacetobacter diazotrophicus]|nr:response regulator transcription factor [Gluconacetobacter diazotrophicus]
MRILLVESDAAATRTLFRVLQNAGFIVDGTETGEDALEMLRHYDYDLAVLSLELADMRGCELLRRLRQSRHAVPAVVLSDTTEAAVRLRAFAAGADDVVSRPFHHDELVARLQAILRRSRGYAAPVLCIGPLQLNLDSREVSVDGCPVHLTGKEYAILELLVMRKGMVLTKDAFLNHLYGGMDEPEMKIIDVFICKLRKKLQLAGAGNLIGTVWGRGYMLRDEPAARPAVPPLPAPVPAILGGRPVPVLAA